VSLSKGSPEDKLGLILECIGEGIRLKGEDVLELKPFKAIPIPENVTKPRFHKLMEIWSKGGKDDEKTPEEEEEEASWAHLEEWDRQERIKDLKIELAKIKIKTSRPYRKIAAKIKKLSTRPPQLNEDGNPIPLWYDRLCAKVYKMPEQVPHEKLNPNPTRIMSLPLM